MDGEQGAAHVRASEGDAARYAAFISYSHAEEEFANWLHKRLEDYRIPRSLVGRVGPAGSQPRRIGKVFRDRVELSAAHDLGGEIRKALERSDALIVLCSQRSAQSEYVEEEIRYFKELGKGDRIFAAILDGEPHAAGKPGRTAADECFPRALMYALGSGAALSDQPEPNEPIAADFRESKDGRENGSLKIIAGLLGVGLDDLVQREKQAERGRRRRFQLIAGAMAVLAVGAAGASVFAFRQTSIAEQQSKEADLQRNQAEQQFAKAAERYSNLVSVTSDEIRRAGNPEISLLMSLYADPTGERMGVSQTYVSAAGYSSARASLAASLVADQVQLVLRTDHPISSAAISPDGKRVVAGFEDADHAQVWDATNASPLVTLTGHTKSLNSVAFSPNGNRIVTTSLDNTARVWDAASGSQLMVLQGHAKGVFSGAFSPDGKRIVTASFDTTARIWDAESGRTLIILTSDRELNFAAYSPDGRRIVTGSDANVGEVWDAGTGSQLVRLVGHTDYVVAGSFSPDGRFILTGSQDGTARLWNAATGQLLKTFDPRAGVIGTVAFSSDGALMLTGSSDAVTRVWDTSTGNLIASLAGHSNLVSSVQISPGSEGILTASWDKTVRLRSVDARPLLAFRGQGGFVPAIGFSPDGTRVVTGLENGTVRVWDAATGAPIATLAGHTKLDGHLNQVTSAAFSPDGQRIVSGGRDMTARVWDAASGNQALVLRGHTDDVETVAFSPDGARILTGGHDGLVLLWDASDGKLLREVQKGGSVRSVEFSPDGKSIITASYDKTARVWNAETGELIATLQHTEWVNSASFSPDGRRAVTASDEHTARIWDTTTWQDVALLQGHTSRVFFATFSPDSKLVITGSLDDTARLWDAGTGKELLTLRSPEPVYSGAFSPDGKRFAVGTGDPTAHVWEVPPVLSASPDSQIKMACERLWRSGARLRFSVSEAAQYPVLQGEAIDPQDSKYLASPCKDVLPGAALAH